MSRMLSKMNLISVVQQLPKEDIETIQGYVEMIEDENNVQKTMIENFVKENQELKQKYLNSVADYETTMSELQELKADYGNKAQVERDLLKEQNQKYKEVIDKITDLIKQYGKYDGEKCTRGFQMWSADFNKILEILKEVE